MPGILPMKMIKVGSAALSRIAQACDRRDQRLTLARRCRSKKIRCDGARPCCSQCVNVDFECKTSDKLSRRAFPRGYTESLEERVRALETEVGELKYLLDERDEKIDVLSRIYSQPPRPFTLPSPRRPLVQPDSKDEPDPNDIFKVQQSPSLQGEGTDSYFVGTSSTRTFIEAYKRKVQEGGKSTADIDTDRLLATRTEKTEDSPPTYESTVVFMTPSRMTTDSNAVCDNAEMSQLNLVFGIAAISSGATSSEDLESFESQWKVAADTILTENSMTTLQVLILAQIFCIQRVELTKIPIYKGLSTTLSARLGLHQSQKRFALGTLTCETRKKVFWTLFSSVVLGLPKNIRDDDIHCEYPVNADDEYVTEHGFQPTLPGESTKLSSALALFRASRILSKVLEEVYPAKASYDLSLKKLSDLSGELDNWHSALPQHLRLPFAQDKPTVGIISSRSPILSMTYHYIRALIQRPAMVQVIQLLHERGLTFSFCLNKDEFLVLSGFGLLFQRLTLDPNSKILKESQKTVAAVVDILTKSKAPCAPEFSKLAKSFLPTPKCAAVTKSSASRSQTKSKTNRHSSEVSPPVSRPHSLQASTKKQLKALASPLFPSPCSKTPDMGSSDRRATVPTICLHPQVPQTHSQPSFSPPQTLESIKIPRSERALNYLSFGDDPITHQPVYAVSSIKTDPQPTDWEKLLGNLDNGQTNIYDACYGRQPIEALLGLNYNPTITHLHSTTTLNSHNSSRLDWNAEFWNSWQANTNTSAPSAVSERAGNNGSIWSYSTDEGTFSAEDLTATASNWSAGSSVTSGFQEPVENFPGIVPPDLDVVGEDMPFPFNRWGDVCA
ncbi:hypothetical protein Q7P35_006812 [Cladosporium inversicolor]